MLIMAERTGVLLVLRHNTGAARYTTEVVMTALHSCI